jgi:hypothetical protein
MNSLISKGFVAVSLLAFALTGCAGGARSDASEPRADGSPRVSTQQGRAGTAAAPPAEGADFSAGDESAPPSQSQPSPASAPAPESASRAGGAARDRSAEKREATLDAEAERPGLGTTWGETRSSRVSNSPFDRQNPNSPFAVTSLHYNDANGINAMLRGSSLSDFRVDRIPAARGMVNVRLLDDNGSALPTLASGGRHFVMGEHGQRYSIEIQNNTGNRLEAVVTVDGLDVIDGRPGSVSKRGYLVNPFATLEIDGFRQSMDEVAAFRFGSVRNSYAGKKGDDRNVGVIGMAFFEERGATFPWTRDELERRERANPFPGGFAQPPR